MTSKFKIEYYHKMPQNASPYLQLLQAKKKIFGYKYQVVKNDKNNREATHNHNKSTGHQPSHKHSKTQSHQKQRKGHKMGSRKKRSHTQQAQERLHESLFLNRDVQIKEGKHQATKSLFTEGGIDQSINPHDFMKNYKNMLEHDEKNLKSLTQQVQGKGLSKSKFRVGQGASLQKLQITEIDDLINLIDSCVEQANDYIAYLTQKIQTMKNESNSMKEEQAKIIKLKDGVIIEKQRQLDRLRRQLHTQNRSEPDKSFQIKKLLEVIDKITEQNNSMKARLRQFQLADLPRPFKDYSQKDKKDIYNQIHNKIDILNISIDKKHQEGTNGQIEQVRQNKKTKSTKNRFYR